MISCTTTELSLTRRPSSAWQRYVSLGRQAPGQGSESD